jgi:hypothetical protein
LLVISAFAIACRAGAAERVVRATGGPSNPKRPNPSLVIALTKDNEEVKKPVPVLSY